MKHFPFGKKRYRIAAFCLCLPLMTALSAPSSPRVPLYRNTAYTFEERAADLVSRLTPEEKQSLLGNSMAAIPRLGIKAYNVWSEALHGILGGANSNAGIEGPTSFPNSVALGSAWDPSLMQREAAAIADEARSFFAAGGKGLTYWSPVVEPIRDPRWGRTGESFGEDPFLVHQIAGGFVRGMVGEYPDYLKSVPCAKHYFANNSEWDRHVGSSNMDARDMREFYLAPYKVLIEKDNIPSIMSSYNAVNGVPTSASKLYLDTIARRTYGMKGYITGDCAAIDDIYSGHNYVKTPEEAAAMGLKAGVDSDCGSVYQRQALRAVEKGLITMEDIDRALLNTFVIRMRTGEFDPAQQVPYALTLPQMVNSRANKALALEVACKTPVLLKNNASTKTNRPVLPLAAESLKKIALIGPQADEVVLGPYSGRPEQSNMVSPLAGITRYLNEKGSNIQIVHSSGGNTSSKSNLLYVANFELKKIDGTVTKFDATKYSAASPGITVGSGMGSLDQVRSINDKSWTAYPNVDLTNIDSMGIFVNIPTEGGLIEVHAGSPEGNLLTTLDATVAGGNRAGGVYGAGSMMRVKVNRLGFNGPQTLYLVYKAPADKGISPETIEAAKNADVAVVFVGTDEKTATEEADRLTLMLPGNQVELIQAVAAVNPNTVVVMQTLGCVEVEAFKNLVNVPGILQVGYNGQAQGDAIARVLFGEVNPGGKLNGTWYKSLNDLPAITDYTLRGNNGQNGRTFWYFNKDVSYEFGYGLSYTTFAYSNFRISKTALTPSDRFTISVDVKNTGAVDGDEVVQIYLRTPDSPAALQRPIKRLKGFKRVTIPVGQTKTVDIDIDAADLWFWDGNKQGMIYDSGKYLFEVGASSKDIKGTLTATMDGAAFKPALKTVVATGDAIVLKSGQRTKSSVTACMSDDRFYDLRKAKVLYRSNNPLVASVDAQGVVTGKATGVATITVSITVDGVVREGSFPIKVMPNLTPASLTVNRKTVAGFRPDNAQYSYLLKKANATPPVVDGTAVDPTIDVVTTQAKAVPGSASITLTDARTAETNAYSVLFGLPSQSDDFTAKTLSKAWSWVRENPTHWSLAQKAGSLVLTSAKGDLSAAGNDAENLLLQSANTDWVMDTKLTCNQKPKGFAQNAGVIAYQDDDNFVRLAYRAGGGRGFRPAAGATPTEQPGSVELTMERNGEQKSPVTLSMEGIVGSDNTLYLRLEKKGDTYTASCSSDGVHFTPVGTQKALLNDIRAGLLVCDGAAPGRMGGMGGFGPGRNQAAAQPAQPTLPFEVAFDYFHITNTGSK
jgi:beta-glucosidase-like glycosyl hydrolase